MLKINELSIEEKVGQMLMIGMDTSDVVDKIDDIILKYKVGGILLYKKNYTNYEEMIELINYIKKINSANKIPLFIAIDQEGGRVNRMPKDFKDIPPANKLAKCKNEDIIEEAAQITGEMLNKSGFNFDFAPVLDIKRFGDSHAIGDRAFSEDKEIVAKYGIKYMKKLQENNIVPVIKHFPGHGATSQDSHFILPVIKKIQNEDIYPFEKAIEEGADSILVSHLKIKGLANYPCSMSRKFITKNLRKKYRYNGLLVTDDMRMKGIKLLYGKNKPVKKAFWSGNDIIVVKYGKDEKLIEKIIKEVKKSKKKEYRVNKSVNRILKIKEKYNCNNKEIRKDENFVQEINKRIEKINEEVNKILNK